MGVTDRSLADETSIWTRSRAPCQRCPQRRNVALSRLVRHGYGRASRTGGTDVLTRHRGSRAPTLLVAAILAAVIVAGCRAEPVDESGLDDIEDSDPVEAEEPEPDPEDGPSEDEGADEPEGDASAEVLDEPDGDGGLIPESAFEINDDLDASEDAQLAVLKAYERAFTLSGQLLAGESVSPEEWEPLFGPDERVRLQTGVDELRADGLVERSDGLESAFVRVEEYSSGQAVVAHCLRNGDGSGIFDAESGEKVYEPPTDWESLRWRMALLEDDDGVAQWAVIDGALVEDVDCA
jgi:hypothetical protein